MIYCHLVKQIRSQASKQRLIYTSSRHQSNAMFALIQRPPGAFRSNTFGLDSTNSEHLSEIRIHSPASSLLCLSILSGSEQVVSTHSHSQLLKYSNSVNGLTPKFHQVRVWSVSDPPFLNILDSCVLNKHIQDPCYWRLSTVKIMVIHWEIKISSYLKTCNNKDLIVVVLKWRFSRLPSFQPGCWRD